MDARMRNCCAGGRGRPVGGAVNNLEEAFRVQYILIGLRAAQADEADFGGRHGIPRWALPAPMIK